MIVNLGLITLLISTILYICIFKQISKCPIGDDRRVGKVFLTVCFLSSIIFVVYALYKDITIDLSNLIKFKHSDTISEQYEAIAK